MDVNERDGFLPGQLVQILSCLPHLGDPLDGGPSSLVVGGGQSEGRIVGEASHRAGKGRDDAMPESATDLGCKPSRILMNGIRIGNLERRREISLRQSRVETLLIAPFTRHCGMGADDDFRHDSSPS